MYLNVPINRICRALGRSNNLSNAPLSLLSAFLTVYFWSLFKTTLFVTWNWTHFWYCERRHFFSRYHLQYKRLSIDSLKKILTPWYDHPDPYTFLCSLVTSGLFFVLLPRTKLKSGSKFRHSNNKADHFRGQSKQKSIIHSIKQSIWVINLFKGNTCTVRNNKNLCSYNWEIVS